MREAVRLVKPGGKIVYSVCTMDPLEGEAVVAFGVTQLGLELVDVFFESDVPGIGNLPGVSGAGLTEVQCKLVRRFTPPRYSEVLQKNYLSPEDAVKECLRKSNH